MTEHAVDGGRVASARRRSVRDEVVWRRLVAVLQQQVARTGRERLDVLDAGGGTGHSAVPLAALGHQVTVVDPSPDSLAALQRRAAEAGVSSQVRAVSGDASGLAEIVGSGSADVVLCHNVLEFVDDPAVALAAIATTLRADAVLSLIGAGRHAAVLAKALSGQIDDAVGALTDPVGRWGDDDPAPRRFTWEELTALVQAAGLAPVERHGLRVFTDLVPGPTAEDPELAAALVRMEELAATHDAFGSIATQLHLIARSAPVDPA